MKIIKYTNWWAFKKREQTIESALTKMDLLNKTAYSKNKSVDNSILETATKNAHENGLVYYVTIYDKEKPYCFIETSKGFYRVCFLDAFLRTYLSYDFRNNINDVIFDKLFLSLVTAWEFDGDSDKVLKISEHIFKPDGTFIIVEQNLINGIRTEKVAKERIDISTNWEKFPKFGDYDSITRKERF